MNALVNATPDQKMSSIDLLKIINDARAQLGESNIRANDFHARVADELDGDNYETFVVQNSNKTTTTAFLLNKDQCTLVAMRESKGVRRNVLDQLKRLQTQAIPQTLPEALRLAADLAEQKAIVEQQLALAAPKVDYYDHVVDRTNLLNATQVAQKVKLSAMQMNRHLDALGVHNHAVKRSRVFQQWFVDKGYGLVRQTESGYPQAMFTLAGEAWVIQKLVSEGVAA